MKPILFSKYQGTGNDFILIDNREGKIPELTTEQVALFCDRKFGVGADGLILLNAHPAYDFEMKNYNSDGSLSSMCGNGARTLIQFASDLGIKKASYRFWAIDGEHEARSEEVDSELLIHVKMQNVSEIKKSSFGLVMNTGSPHLVLERDQIEGIDVFEEGRALRYHSEFAPAGLNVNFIESGSTPVKIRTYERGVEDETLSCGTGVIAAALSLAESNSTLYPPGQHRIAFQAKGGQLQVQFEKVSPSHYQNIWLIGPARKTFSGLFNEIT